MVFAVGGGRAIDTCKTLCDMENKPVFSFPTIASNCSPVTAVCVIYDDETHGFKELYFPQKSPLHSFINTKIITEAPYEYIWLVSVMLYPNNMKLAFPLVMMK